MHTCQKQINGLSDNERGFTLIEVMVALVIFAVGLLAVATMQISSIGGNSTASQITDASTLAANQVEILMGLPYADPDLANGAHPALISGNYQITWTVTDDTPTTATKTVTVNVQNLLDNRTVFYTSVVPEII